MLKSKRGVSACSLSSCRIRAEALARAFNTRLWPCTWLPRKSSASGDDGISNGIDEDEEFFDASPSPEEIGEESLLCQCQQHNSAATEAGRAKLYELLQQHAGDDVNDVFYDVSEHAGLTESSEDTCFDMREPIQVDDFCESSQCCRLVDDELNILSKPNDYIGDGMLNELKISGDNQSSNALAKDEISENVESMPCDSSNVDVSESDLEISISVSSCVLNNSYHSQNKELNSNESKTKCLYKDGGLFNQEQPDTFVSYNIYNIDCSKNCGCNELKQNDIEAACLEKEEQNILKENSSEIVHEKEDLLSEFKYPSSVKDETEESIEEDAATNEITEVSDLPSLFPPDETDVMKQENASIDKLVDSDITLKPIDNESQYSGSDNNETKTSIKEETAASEIAGESDLSSLITNDEKNVKNQQNTSINGLEDSDLTSKLIDNESILKLTNVSNVEIEIIRTNTPSPTSPDPKNLSPASSRLQVFQDDRPKISRSTSLKTGKTPPGTPSRKKIVRFADVLGLDLEDVRHIMTGDLPTIPSSAYTDLDLKGMDFPTSEPVSKTIEIKCRQTTYWNNLQGATATNAFYPAFPIPGEQPDFLNRVRTQCICLETVVVSEMSIRCTCRVMNLGFHKKVLARYTVNDWLSSNDIDALYVQGSSNAEMDGFGFSIFLSPANRNVQFALKYTVNGKEYWDNNRGQNYRLSFHGNASDQMQQVSTNSHWQHQFW